MARAARPPRPARADPHPPGVDRRGTGGHGWSRVEAVAILDDPTRGDREKPDEVWSRARLARGEDVAEIGAGTGYYSFSAARVVGRTGRVYAVDLSTDLIALIRERAARRRLPQVKAILSRVDAIPLDAASVDLVLFANSLHDVPDATVREAVRLLRPGGRLVNVDWVTRATPVGPPAGIRLSPEAAASRLAVHGLVAEAPWAFGPWHYGFVARRPADSARGSDRGGRASR